MMPIVEAPDIAEDLFETSQTVCAAFLVYMGHPVHDTEWSHRSCTFLFRRTTELSEDFADFTQGTARVEPVAFSNSFGECTSLVKEARSKEKQRLGLRPDQRLEDL